jgi:pyridoxal phosphate enzyme (YggS family)
VPATRLAEIKDRLAERIDSVRDRMAAACRRAGRVPEEVTLVAVTKTVSAEIASLLPDLGIFDLGESRPQELWKKAAALPGMVRWHLIGHLQRNKIAATLPLVSMIHSVDSVRLLQALEEAAAQQERTVPVLLEVNASGETNKQGFAPEALLNLMPAIADLRHVSIEGLMTMAALESDPEKCRPVFVKLRQLRDERSRRYIIDSSAPGPGSLRRLSMGMSNDFEIAIEEGATMVRIGTTLFAGLAENEP